MEKVLVHFLETALHKSLSRASESLGITQPAISKSIKILESRYGITLVERKARGIELTAAGNLLLERVLRIEHEMDGIKQSMSALLSEQRSLNIGAGPAWESPISAILPSFLLTYPDCKVEVRSGPICDLITPLIDNEIDLAFGGEDGSLLVQNNAVSFIPLKRSRLCIVAHNSHPLAGDQISLPDQLTRFPWIAYQHSEQMLFRLNQFLTREGARPVQFIVETDFLDMTLNLMSESDALLCVSDQLLPRIQAAGLVEIRLSEPLWHFNLGVWSHAKQQRHDITEAFLSEMKSYLFKNDANQPF